MRYKSVEVQVPAKVNLQLSVGPKKPNGYHDVVTVFQAISLSDTLKISRGEQFNLTVKGDYTSGVPLDQSNLVYKAIELMAEKFNTDLNLEIEIDKSIPVAGGMAGGSADAAGVLVGIDSLFELGLSRDELEKIAAELGSDVPFSIAGGIAIGRGHGDQITPALARGNYHWVLALSSQGLSTPAVYKECDRLREGMEVSKPQINSALLQALGSGNPYEVGRSLTNDLQAAACSLRPALRLVLDVGKEYGALGGIVSGSGPTVAFLVEDDEKSLDLSVALSASGVVAGVARASGPVHGARVVETL